jgi:transposase
MAAGIDKAFLEQCLAKGMSLPEIGRLVGRPPGTVGYWVKRHGLIANGASKFSPGGGIARKRLELCIAEGLVPREIASRLGVCVQTVYHWLNEYEIQLPGQADREAISAARGAGEAII